MKPRTLAAFVAPSVALMFIFIALPLISVAIQSVYSVQPIYEQVEEEICTPGFPSPTCTKEIKPKPKLDAAGKQITETRFIGFDAYRTLLQPQAVARALSPGGGGWSAITAIDFYSALRFTLFFTIVTLPLVVGLGLLIALTVNNAVKSIRGPLIFASLLPLIITPVIGALSIKWLFFGDGIMTVFIEWILQRDISMFAQGWTIELLMLFYRVWHVAPFAFIIFYAGLQTVDQDTMESAIIDGASRLERLRYVIIPHLMPLIIFVSLIHLMDSYRVFDEVIGFGSEAYRISLQWLTYNLLTPDMTGNRSITRASASSMLTMVGIVIILIPLLRRTWRDHRASMR
jgi:multiple sugar transport system permease protein